MTPADWDREPTSDAERARWRVWSVDSRFVETDDGFTYVGTFDTPALAAEAVHAHNVLHAAREQRALGVGLHDGCVAREALVQVGCDTNHALLPGADSRPVYRLRTDEDTTEGAT